MSDSHATVGSSNSSPDHSGDEGHSSAGRERKKPVKFTRHRSSIDKICGRWRLPYREVLELCYMFELQQTKEEDVDTTTAADSTAATAAGETRAHEPPQYNHLVRAAGQPPVYATPQGDYDHLSGP